MQLIFMKNVLINTVKKPNTEFQLTTIPSTHAEGASDVMTQAVA